jgi:hypothetical protein
MIFSWKVVFEEQFRNIGMKVQFLSLLLVQMLVRGQGLVVLAVVHPVVRGIGSAVTILLSTGS